MVTLERESHFSQKLAVLGGGTGEFNLLRGLVKFNQPEGITAIPGTWDSGGSSGRLRTELGSLPHGDGRRCFFGLMEDEDQLLEALRLSDNRLQEIVGPLKGHDLFNLIIDQLSRIHQGQDRGFEAFKKIFRIRGHVIPSSLINMDIIAKLNSGKEIYGEAEIDRRWNTPDFDPHDQIERIYPNTPPVSNPQAVKAIDEADKIVFASGSLWGSVLPHLLIEDIQKAILRSKASLIFVLNLMTERGQTDFFKASDHLRPFISYLGKKRRIDYMVVNTNNLDPEVLEIYKREGQEPVEVDEEECKKLAPRLEIIRKDLATYLPREHLLRHDPIKLAQTVLELD